MDAPEKESVHASDVYKRQDLLGTEDAKFVSLTRYAGNPLLTTVIAALIVFGGLGFLTWEDIMFICMFRRAIPSFRFSNSSTYMLIKI